MGARIHCHLLQRRLRGEVGNGGHADVREDTKLVARPQLTRAYCGTSSAYARRQLPMFGAGETASGSWARCV